ncbi:hypothetical protein ACTHGU_15525 [Chitinophagaceae bacterium MMS25-I14]
MKSSEQNSLNVYFSGLRNNTTIINSPEQLDLSNIADGILIVYAIWSGAAMLNCIRAIQLLYEINYAGKIIAIDNDSFTPDEQTKILGQVCQGWGEIFVIHNAVVIECYPGKNSFNLFKTQHAGV